MVIIKKNPQTINAREGVERRELSCIVGGNVNWYSHYGDQYGGFLKTKNRSTILPCNPTCGHISGGKHAWKWYMHPNALTLKRKLMLFLLAIYQVLTLLSTSFPFLCITLVEAFPISGNYLVYILINWYSPWIASRWQSRRMCTHSLREHWNHNKLLNHHWQEDARTNQKSCPTYPETKEKLQWDSRRGAIMIK